MKNTIQEIKPVSGSSRESIIGELDDRLSALFNQLVPTSGKSNTIEGEMIRAINRIIYRNYNSGDYFYKGYGTETAGPAMSFLSHSNSIPAEIRRQIKNIENEAVGETDERYEDLIYKIAKIIIQYIESKNGEYTESTEDLFDYRSEYQDEEEDDEDDYYGYGDEEDEEDEDEFYESISEALTKSQEKNKDRILQDLIKTNKRHWIDLYKNKAEWYMTGRAINLAKKTSNNLEEIAFETKLRETIKTALMKPLAEPKLSEIKVVAPHDTIPGANYLTPSKKTIDSWEEEDAWAWFNQMNDEAYDHQQYNRAELRSNTDAVNAVRKYLKIDEKMDPLNEKLRKTIKTALMKPMAEKMDPIGREDNDINNDGTVDKTDKYLANRRAAIAKNVQTEDLDLGHEDNEPHMIKGELYRIGKYAMELYQMVDEFEYGYGEVDFPAWWQAMITDAASKMVKAKHYLDFETKEPEIDAMVGAIDMSGALDNIGVDELRESEMLNEVEPTTLIFGTIAALLGVVGGGAALMDKMEKIAKEKPDSRTAQIYNTLTDLGNQASKSGDKTVKEAKKDEYGNHLEPQFKKGDKVTYLGNPGEITGVNKEMAGAYTYNVSYDKGNGRTKVSNLSNKGGEIKLAETKSVEEVKQDTKDKESLRYALATNLAKTGKPQTQPGAKSAKLTPGLEKKREANVKKLKKYIKEALPKGYWSSKTKKGKR